MAQTATCPEIKDFLAANECLENFGGLGVNVYVFLKSDLKAPLKAEKNVYTALTSESFNTGKGLYKFECKENSQGHTFESLGRRKGFKQQLDYVLESVNAASAELARALITSTLAISYRTARRASSCMTTSTSLSMLRVESRVTLARNPTMIVRWNCPAPSSLQPTDATRSQRLN